MTGLLRRFLPFLPGPPVVAVVRLEGVIASGGRMSRGLSLAGVESALERAFALKAEAVAIAINSPGGSPVQSRLIHDRVRALAAERKRLVLTFCEDVAASGGYILALAGDEVFADPSSLVGSIGVVGAGFGFDGAMAKLGVERRVYAAGRNKVRLDPFQPEKPEDVAWLRRLQDHIHDDFIALVQERRAGKLDAATDLFEGDVWTGRDAFRLGLVDGLGGMRGVLAQKFGPKVRLRRFWPAKSSILSRILGGGADALLDAVETRALWARFGL